MGPNNPWSPNWRPDPTGRRLVAIRAARRGALLAGIAYIPLGAAALAVVQQPRELALVALAVGLPGVALLGAGLAPATLDSRIDAVVAGIAFAIGSPVAAVTSIVIGAFVMFNVVPWSEGADPGGGDVAGTVLRAGVTAALRISPLIALVSAGWVLLVRRLSRPTPRPADAP
jgi:hypothetical protein